MSEIVSKVVDFEGLQISYDDRVLAPRAWTAAQSHWAADLARTAPPGPVLELCSGAGHIGLLAARLTSRPLVCVDASSAACAYLRANAAAAGLPVEVREGPMDQVLGEGERFHVVIADPPWVRRDRTGDFPEDPLSAIDGGPDGLDLVRACLDVIEGHLDRQGSAVLQIGPGQTEAVRTLVEQRSRLTVVETRDYDRGTLLRIDASHDRS